MSGSTNWSTIFHFRHQFRVLPSNKKMTLRNRTFILLLLLSILGSSIFLIVYYLFIFCSASSVSLIATVAGHSSWVLSVAVSPDGQQIATSSADSTIKMWEFGSRPQSLCTFKEHSDQVEKKILF